MTRGLPRFPCPLSPLSCPLPRFEHFPPETKDVWYELERRRDSMVNQARDAVRTMSTDAHADLFIAVEALVLYEAYPQHIRGMLAQWYARLVGKAAQPGRSII